jgi:hypothetical protein
VQDLLETAEARHVAEELRARFAVADVERKKIAEDTKRSAREECIRLVCQAFEVERREDLMNDGGHLCEVNTDKPHSLRHDSPLNDPSTREPSTANDLLTMDEQDLCPSTPRIALATTLPLTSLTTPLQPRNDPRNASSASTDNAPPLSISAACSVHISYMKRPHSPSIDISPLPSTTACRQEGQQINLAGTTENPEKERGIS